MVFGLPHISDYYKFEIMPYAVPYILPTLQTFLTISVYTTVAIAISGAIEVVQISGSCCNIMLRWLKPKRIQFTIIAIVLFSIVFNASRWFEIKTFETFDSQYNETFAILQVIKPKFFH